MMNIIKVLHGFADTGNGVRYPTQEDLGLPNVQANSNMVQNFLGIAFGVIGALAVLIIVISALNMTKSYGNPEEVSKAKRSIIYAVVGLLVAISGEMIVNFVLGKV